MGSPRLGWIGDLGQSLMLQHRLEASGMTAPLTIGHETDGRGHSAHIVNCLREEW